MKNTIYVSLFCFFFGFLVGLFLIPKHDAFINSGEFNPFKLSQSALFLFIFKHNVKSLIHLWSGALTFGATTLLNLAFNGMSFGSAVKTTAGQIGLTKTLLLILPHGIFEIPGMIIAGVAGFKIPYELLRFALGKKEEMITEEDAKEFFKLVAISIVLIFIAALIESTVTAKIAERI